MITTREVNLPEVDSVTITKKEIGKGSFGRVLEATTLCAVKVIHPILVNDCNPEELAALNEKFLKECLHCSQLCHPNIVQFLGIHYPSEDVKLPWLVMEKMECSLKQFLIVHKPTEVSLEVRMSILHDVSLGLQYLHVQDIIHRDLSSNNVLLTKQLVAKIGDLGVAKFIDPTGTMTATQAPGTVTFMPPEALKCNPTYGKPVDVFSLGCVMIHTMTHKWPVPKDEIHIDKETGKKSALSEIERREDYLSLIQPDELTVCIKQCLNSLPDCRPTVSDVSKVLQNIQPNLQLPNLQSFLYRFQTSLQTIDELQQERDTLIQKLEKLSQEQGRLFHTDRELKKANEDKADLKKYLYQSTLINLRMGEEHQNSKKGKRNETLDQCKQILDHCKTLLKIDDQATVKYHDTTQIDQYEAENLQELQKGKEEYDTLGSGKPEVKPKSRPRLRAVSFSQTTSYSQDGHQRDDFKCQPLKARSRNQPFS